MIEDKTNSTMVNNIVEKIEGIDENVTGVLVPILRDTVSDYRKVVNKLIVIIVILIFGLIGMAVSGYFIISRQINKYNDFLSQFDFESDTSVYQDTDDNSAINSGINFTN